MTHPNSMVPEATLRIRAAVEQKSTSLDLSDLELTQVPEDIFQITSLRRLNLEYNPFNQLSDEIGRLVNLEFLNVANTGLTNLPASLCSITQLRSLSLSGTRISELAEAFVDHPNLERLKIRGTPLNPVPLLVARQQRWRGLYLELSWLVQCIHMGCKFPALQELAIRTMTNESLGPPLVEQLAGLGNLEELELNGSFDQLPDTVGELIGLRRLAIYGSALTALPESIGRLTKLEQLDVSGNQLVALPEAIGQLAKLQQLHVSGNQLAALPEAIGRLTKLQQLHVWNNQLVALPEAIGQLAKLEQLDVSDNQLAALPEAIGRLTKLQQLHVWNNQLVALPEAIGQLTKLEQLDVSDNQLAALPEAIGRLTKLQQLHVWNNQLVALPEAIGQLTNLQHLYVGSNQLVALPEAIGQLTKLQQLYVGANQLAALPEVIGQLTNLQQLSVGDNQLVALPEAIGQLTKLELLDVSGNQFAASPEAIGQLTKLQQLHVGGNQLVALPEAIGQLTKLQQLHVGGNQLAALPEAIGQLTKLELLDVSGNQFAALPEAIGQLTKLQQLHVGGNQLAALPEAIGQLTNLQQLDVSDNRLRVLPEAIGKLTALLEISAAHNELKTLPNVFDRLPLLLDLDLSHNELRELPDSLRGAQVAWLMLQGNRNLEIPASILGKYVDKWSRRRERVERGERKPASILTHYFANRDLDGAPLNEVKLLVVGRGESGKTTLMRRLRGKPFGKPPKETQGIDIKPWEIKCDDLTVRVNVWDFAGQVITHATHQFFLTERSIYLLLLTGRGDLQRGDADYWLRLIQAFGTDDDGQTSPVLIALNKWEPPGFKLDRNGLKEKYPFIAGFVETECKSGLGLLELHELLRKTITAMSDVRQPIPLPWWRIKQAIERRQKRVNHMPFGDFKDICMRAGSKTEELSTLSKLLHSLGVALNYGDDERLRNNTVLNPSWVTSSIYALLRNAANPETAEMSLADVARVLPNESIEMQRYLVELMRRFDLAFPLTDEGDRWLVPQRLPEEQPELGQEWQSNDATRMRFSYSALPEGLLPRFITRTYPLGQGERANESLPRWAHGVVLADQDARALVKTYPEDREIHVTALGSPEARQGLLGLIESEFARIHEEIKGLNPRVELRVASKNGSDWIRLDTLRADEQQHKSSYLSTDHGTVEVTPTTELNRVSAPEARDPSSWKARVFVSYCSKDLRFKDELLMRLRQLQRAEGLINVWHDGLIAPGDEWDGEIRAEIGRSDVILLLVSNHFLDSEYIRGVEIQLAVDLANRKATRLIPIVLEDCLWTTESFGRFNALPRKGAPIRDYSPQRHAWEHVRKELSKLVKQMRDENSKLTREEWARRDFHRTGARPL